MRVYELMNELNYLPAGAEVFVHGLRTVPDLRSGYIVDIDENKEEIYAIDGSVADIDSDTKTMQVYLYF